MPYAIELYFDPVTKRSIENAWCGVLKGGSEYLLRNNVPPHVALAVMEECERAGALREELAGLSAEIQCFSLKASKVGIFHGELPTLYLAFEHETRLQEVHAKVAAVLERMGVACHEYYRAGNWIPHCSLAQNFPSDRLADVMSAAESLDWNLPLELCSLALVEYPPTKVLGKWPLF